MSTNNHTVHMTLKCPGFDPPKPTDLDRCIADTVKWVALTTMDEVLLTKTQINDKFEQLWIKVTKEKDTNQVVYWEGFRRSRRALASIYWLNTKYIALAPFQTRLVGFGTNMVQVDCTCALLAPRYTRKDLVKVPTTVLQLRVGKAPKLRIPDPLDILCVGATSFGISSIINLSTSGAKWTYKNLDRLAVRQQAQKIISIYEALRGTPAYFVPGAHCEQCQTKACQKVFQDG